MWYCTQEKYLKTVNFVLNIFLHKFNLQTTFDYWYNDSGDLSEHFRAHPKEKTQIKNEENQ